MNNALILLISLILSVVGIYALIPKSTKEDFGMNPPMVAYVDKTMSGPSKGDFYSVPGTFQAALSPRFSNLNYGAYIKYNMPSIKHQGVPANPLTFASMGGGCNNKPASNEGYCGGAGVTSCKRGGLPLNEQNNYNYTQGVGGPSVQAQQQNIFASVSLPNVTDMLPVGDMSASGDASCQPIIYDRYMNANLKNTRLRSQGDMLRGDLPIKPTKNGWFDVSVQPVRDLQSGALAVMGGVDLDSAKKMWNLMSENSGSTKSTLGGVNLASPQINMASAMPVMLTAGQGDINATAFP